MNKEIKEILDNVKLCCDITKDQSFTIYQRQDILELLDYITNLQEENKRLEKNQRYMKKGVFSLEYDKETLIDMIDELNERFDKAKEYNEQIIQDIKDFYRPTSDRIYSGDVIIENAQININILNGDDNNEDN